MPKMSSLGGVVNREEMRNEGGRWKSAAELPHVCGEMGICPGDGASLEKLGHLPGPLGILSRLSSSPKKLSIS